MSWKPGGTGSTNTTTYAPISPEEQRLIDLQSQLSQQQLNSLNSMQPYEQQLLQYSQNQLSSQNAYQNALDAAISPADRAAAAKAQFDQAQQLGPMQTQLAQMQLDALKQGGRATDQQKADIASATDASIAAGNAGIDTNTRRGIGMISDELGNARGLRLSDAPIGSEAALLTRAGTDQKAGLESSMRANQANATLNYPLAVQSMQSGINLGQQNSNASFSQFQNGLQQQAYQNRMSMTGPAITSGLGMSGIGGGSGALSALNSNRGSTSVGTGSNNSQGMSGLGSLMSGLGSLASFSDPRLKDDYGVVGETTSGIPLHLYHYKGESTDTPVRLGVMADEVKKIKPEAVIRHSSGYDMVNYASIGLAK
jgi:hypothetical protein